MYDLLIKKRTLEQIEDKAIRKQLITQVSQGIYEKVNVMERIIYEREYLYHPRAFEPDVEEEVMILPYKFICFTYSAHGLVTGGKWGRRRTCPQCEGWGGIDCDECDCDGDGFVADEGDLIFTDLADNQRHVFVDYDTAWLPFS